MLSGGLLIDKPPNATSHDVVALVRRFIGIKRVGHTGTLDPFATGLLVLCLGPATRLSRFLTDTSKSYRAVLRFGFATDTQDLTGQPLTPPRATQGLTEDQLQAVAQTFLGKQMQTPPMYSARKIDGVALYQLARAGKVVVRAATPIEVFSFNFLPDAQGRVIRQDQQGAPIVECEVTCSSGTYIRTLAHDIGERIGCGAHLVALRRTAVDGFTVDEALTLEDLQRCVMSGEWSGQVLSPLDLLRGWPRVRLGQPLANRFICGQALDISPDDITPDNRRPFPVAPEVGVAVTDEAGYFLGVGRYDHRTGWLRPQTVMPTAH
ncbi:MAG: tRNA pseudouridine(55) synthase TruB [Chloracidobacterium sp.]|uniref:tRNA pseudouridine synthase B n=1 Tax=Chloracidobacterium validum TaxID=2821543 RepID=A0ABX8B5C6_9BACT|nr:tRNA pseudouridine(55) synthase TruB [Chloracidobacterium validum]QUW02133.1 tRNA pseudouridine(55) synthase TruB [Chloracidobacterium validum]